MKNTKITFPYVPAVSSVAQVAAIAVAAGIQIEISSTNVQGNVLVVTADRLLTADEKTAVATAFHAAFPRIEDVD